MQNSWIAQLDPQIPARSMDSCAKYGSIDCAARSMDRADPQIALNNYIQHCFLLRALYSPGCRCPDVFVKLIYICVLCHSAFIRPSSDAYQTCYYICKLFLTPLSWFSSASFSGYHYLHYFLLFFLLVAVRSICGVVCTVKCHDTQLLSYLNVYTEWTVYSVTPPANNIRFCKTIK